MTRAEQILKTLEEARTAVGMVRKAQKADAERLEKKVAKSAKEIGVDRSELPKEDKMTGAQRAELNRKYRSERQAGFGGYTSMGAEKRRGGASQKPPRW